MKERVLNKDGICIQIPVEKVDEYLREGWTLGRGKPAWNKGLTKETNESVALNAKNSAETHKNWTQKYKKDLAQRISKKLKGIKRTPEYLEKRSKAQRGLKRTEEFKKAQSERFKGHLVSEETRQKISKANLGKPGVPCSEEHKHRISIHNSSKEFQKYQRDLKIKNGTINTSKPENKCFEKLKERFKTVIRYYSEERYPFECDAYIKELDLFIEFNFHWTHGKHPYNEELDKETLNTWLEKAKTSKFYKQAINTWTIRDVNKIKTAKNNKLNYLRFYNEKDFNKWLDK